MYLPHVSHDRVFLSVNKALQHHSNSHVDVVVVYILPQVHPGVGLRDTNDGLDVTNCDRNTASPLYRVCVCEWEGTCIYKYGSLGSRPSRSRTCIYLIACRGRPGIKYHVRVDSG